MKISIFLNKAVRIVMFLTIAAFTLASCDEELIYPDENKLPPAKYDTSDWVITDYSSQEDQGGEGNTGRAADILDGNTDTFWHSCWNGCTPVPPHYITVDMQTENEITGFFLVQRQSLTRNIEKLEIQISNDGSTWETAGVYDLEQIAAQQELVLNERRTFRYFKMTVVSVFDGSDNAALAELTPYITYN